MLERERTSAEVIQYLLYLYFPGLSSEIHLEQSNHLEKKEEGVMLLHGNDFKGSISDVSSAWLWMTIEPINRQILGVYISRHRNMIVAESFLGSLIDLW
jgi:hypothetical protein